MTSVQKGPSILELISDELDKVMRQVVDEYRAVNAGQGKTSKLNEYTERAWGLSIALGKIVSPYDKTYASAQTQWTESTQRVIMGEDQ